MNTLSNPLPKKQKAPAPRELTAREKALEFAKNVKKPKTNVKKADQSGIGEKGDQNKNGDMRSINEDSNEDLVDTMGGTGTGDQLGGE